MEVQWYDKVPDKPIVVFDLEGDGLDPTKIYCVCYSVYKPGQKTEVHSITDVKEMKEFFQRDYIFVGHNIVLWDIPCAIKKLLGINSISWWEKNVLDTLWVSRYICPALNQHDLDSWGSRLGVDKPKIDDWYGLSVEEYVHRCSEDVKINVKLLEYLFTKLDVVYQNKKNQWRFLWYLMFKADCVAQQEQDKILLDINAVERHLYKLETRKEKIVAALSSVMPKNPKKGIKNKPKILYKKDGSWSTHCKRWLKFLEEQNLPFDTEGPVEYIKEYEVGNPNSTQQIKDWLFDLGWEPKKYKYVKEDDGSFRKIPQVRVDTDDGKQLCPSVMKLTEKEPNIKLLSEITMLTHRIGYFKGFLNDSDENGFIQASASGTTNTLRLRHVKLVNLPGVDRFYGKEVRGSLIAREGYEFCGSDMSSLENRTRDHFIYPYDPSYVETMMDPEYDPHLEIALSANLMSEEEVEWYKKIKYKHIDYSGLSKEEKEKYGSLGVIRHKAKTTFYSATYGVGADKLARELECSKEEAASLLKAYWDRNWSIKEFEKHCQVRDTGKELWVLNPLSGFWYSLRNRKDIFSTVNQSAGVFVFDTWIKLFRNKRRQLSAQFHDEVLLEVKKGYRELVEKELRSHISRINKDMGLLREMDIDVQFGDSYADVH